MKGTLRLKLQPAQSGGKSTGCRPMMRLPAAAWEGSSSPLNWYGGYLTETCNHERRLPSLNHVSCLARSKAIILQVASGTLHCSASVFCTQKPPSVLTSTANVSRLAYGDSLHSYWHAVRKCKLACNQCEMNGHVGAL